MGKPWGRNLMLGFWQAALLVLAVLFDVRGPCADAIAPTAVSQEGPRAAARWAAQRRRRPARLVPARRP